MLSYNKFNQIHRIEKMDRDLEQKLAMETNFEMMAAILNTCREKTIKKSHSTETLTSDEKSQFNNCVVKFFEAPNYIMSAMQSQMGN